MKYESNIIPDVGVYEGVPAQTYFSWRAVNHSTLKEIDRSPAHFRFAQFAGNDDTEAKLFGTVTHAALLEPARFRESMVLGPINPRTDKAFGVGTNAWNDFADANPGKIVVSEDLIERLGTIIHNLEANADAMALLTGPGKNELTMVWDDPVTGLRCKGRIDRYRADFGRIDIKTAVTANPNEFSRKGVLTYGYHTQDDWYRRGVEVLGLGKSNGVLVVVENESPHLNIIVEWCEETCKLARIHNLERLMKVKECVDRGEWPGYPAGINTLSAPTFAFQGFGMGV